MTIGAELEPANTYMRTPSMRDHANRMRERADAIRAEAETLDHVAAVGLPLPTVEEYRAAVQTAAADIVDSRFATDLPELAAHSGGDKELTDDLPF